MSWGDRATRAGELLACARSGPDADRRAAAQGGRARWCGRDDRALPADGGRNDGISPVPARCRRRGLARRLRPGGLKDGGLTDGARAQTAQALANLRAVVESHGADLADVVKTNVFLVSMDDYAAMNEEYAKVFPDDSPARSAVAVHQLPLGALVEIEAWVHLPGR
jgi:2-iminobutanoate/2-iminopropanoate deaminase